MRLKKHFRYLLLLLLLMPITASAESAAHLKVGVVASLSDFAAEYGQEVVNGVKLAQERLHSQGLQVSLIIEDDHSDARKAVDAYTKLAKLDRVDLIIAGTWWANSFAKLAERDSIPLLSCETLMEESTVDASSYFILPGHLRDWILVYDELFKQLNLKSLSILRFSSGFGATLSKVLQDLLKTSHPNTQFAGAIEYQDIAMAEAATLLLKIKQINPAGLYIDAQPTGIANFIRKLNQQGAYGFTIFSNSIVEDLLVQKLVDPNMLEGVYFSKRKIFSGRFIEEYRALYKREPRLSADLGYYALLIALKAYASGDLLKSLTTDKYIIDAQEFQFDTQRVLANSKQEIFQIKEGQIRPLLKE